MLRARFDHRRYVQTQQHRGLHESNTSGACGSPGGRRISVAAIAPALANDIFLNIQGVTGPVTNAGFVGDIQLTAYSQGFTDPATLASGTGAGAGKTTTTCGAINITKMVDSTSPDFLQYVTRGVGFKPPRSTSLAPRTVQPLRTCPIPSSSITSASYPLRKATPSATPRVSGSLGTSR